ncbi:helix-turn-helix domain-containing protein [Saccharopolyspora aridisoli]|uniref:helix-turn-helix domain-containing protein n=1 Tax=Saccharopolyspora aridisoli TaxID=2530385 RepID=UPI0038B594EC
MRARRALVTSEQAGIPVTGVRRVPGLRREEVAMLAGISADYCLRSEQGRDRNPSVQVLESLARVLRLDEAATDHLLRLGTAKPKRRHKQPVRKIGPSTAKRLTIKALPAFVESRYGSAHARGPSEGRATSSSRTISVPAGLNRK